MARKTSPFAELTNEQKQLKWLEYQSIRLPYTEAELMPPMVENTACTAMTAAEAGMQAEHPSASPVISNSAQPVQPQSSARQNRPMPPPEVYMQNKTPAPMQATNIQKIRHHQYDAVIARMKQAEMRTGSYQAWSK